MAELFLIRHGEAVGQGNYNGRRTDPPLTVTGRRQAASLRNLLEADGILPADTTGLFVSPMQRALETAGILFADGSAAPASEYAEVVGELAEMDFGDWDGLSWKEINARAGKSYEKWLDDPVNIAPPGGETLNEFTARVDRGLERVFSTAAGDTGAQPEPPLIITAHGGVIRCIICILLGLHPGKHLSFRIDPASCTSLSTYKTLVGTRGAVLNFLNRK